MAKKRSVSDGYEFKSRILYPRWQILIRDLSDLREGDIEPSLYVRVDHRFKVGDEWKQLMVMLQVPEKSRRVLSFLVRSAMSEIRHTRNNHVASNPTGTL